MDELRREYEENKQLIDTLNNRNEEIKKLILDKMKDEEIDTYMTKTSTISYIPKSTTYIFNSTQFKKDEKELYEKYRTQERTTNEQVRILSRKS